MPLNKSSTEEWERRAKRRGLQSVMSTRWTPQQCKTATKELKTDIFSFLPDLNDKKVLDVGCGIGRFTDDLLKNTREIYAVDISSSMLTRARKTFKSKGVKIFKESVHKLHFDDDSFDLSFEVTVLQHIIDENMFKQTLKELKRVTKSSGLIFLCGEMAEKDNVVSPYTVLRSIDSYSREMKPWKLKKTKNHKCITDNYKLTLWSL